MAQVGQYQIGSFASPVNGGPLDATVVRGNDNAVVGVHDNHDNDPTIHVQSFPFASLPSASTLGRFLIASDTHRAYFDTGSVLAELAYLSTAGGTITGNLTLTGSLTAASNITTNGIVTSSVTSGTGIFRAISSGGSGRSWDVRSNTSGLFSIVDVTGGQTRLTIDSTGALTTFGGTLTVSGAGIVAGGSNFSGAVAISAGGLTVAGGATISSGGLALTGAGNNASFGGSLTVAGLTTLAATQFSGSAGSVVFGSQVIGSALTPSTTATYDLGATGTRWNSLFLSAGISAGGQISGQQLVATANATVGTTLAVSGLSTLNKIKGGGSTPTVSASNGTASVVGTDTAGIVSWTPSSNISGPALTLTFSAAFATTPYAVVCANSLGQVQPTAPSFLGCNATTSTLVILGGGSAADYTAGSTYKFVYQVIA